MEFDRRHNVLLLGFLFLSLLLHLLLIYMMPGITLFPTPPAKEPVVVEMRPPLPSPKPLDRELDLPPQTRETPRTRPAKRLGPINRQVERESAPKGEMTEDSMPEVGRRLAPPAAPSTAKLPPAPPAAPPAALRPEGEGPAPATTQPAPQRSPEVSRKTLMASAERAAENVAAQQMAELRRKYREEVEQGDAVWLDTEKDLLISFFKRFRDNIYGVWNYPRSSAERGEEGTCLLKITFNRNGTVHEVKLVEPSGYEALDKEALAAVRKGAPYGPISRHYKEETLTIFAFFRYQLGLRYLIGEP